MRFPGRALEPEELAPGEEPSAGAEQAAAGRSKRRRGDDPDSLGRYLLTALGLFVAVGLVSLALIQATQAGRASQSDFNSPAHAAPASAAPAPPAAAQPRPAPPAPAGAVRVTSRVVEPRYVVAPGDSLGSIAAKTGTTIEALQSINNLADRNVLSVGQRLVIPNQD